MESPMPGQIISIYITPSAGEPPQAVDQVQAVPGLGLQGDRYFLQQGTYSDKPSPGRQLTLIESEALDDLAAGAGIHLDGAQSRRNLLTRGVQLNALVGVTFRIGAVTVHGVRLCEPCEYLEGLTQPGVLRGLVHRGGLRADILTPGTIHVGDPVDLLK